MSEYVKLSEPRERRIGGVTFVITAYGNPQSKKTANDLLFEMLEAKVKYPTEQEGSL